MCHMSCVTCHMSGVRCQVSLVRCQISCVKCNFLFCFFIFIKKNYKVVEIVGGGFVINDAYPVQVFVCYMNGENQ